MVAVGPAGAGYRCRSESNTLGSFLRVVPQSSSAQAIVPRQVFAVPELPEKAQPDDCPGQNRDTETQTGIGECRNLAIRRFYSQTPGLHTESST